MNSLATHYSLHILMLVSIKDVCICAIAQSATLSAMEAALQESLFALTVTLQ